MVGSTLNLPNAALNSRKINSRAASKPPSRKIAPSKRLKCVRQRGRALAPAVRFLAVAENQVRAQAERAGVLGQRAAVDQFGARLGQRAFVERGKFFVKLVGQDELQHGVAEKFQPLIVRLVGVAAFVRDGRMRQRQPQQALVAKRVAEAGLKFGEETLMIMIDD